MLPSAKAALHQSGQFGFRRRERPPRKEGQSCHFDAMYRSHKALDQNCQHWFTVIPEEQIISQRRRARTMSNFDVTVIIPSFNSEEFIRRSVTSALDQAGVTAQLIIVDDKGNDNTRGLLEEIRDDNPNRSILLEYRDCGLGQATARNRGIELAEGRYIAFLDSDDAFAHARVLVDWVEFADRLDLEMAGGQYYHIGEDGAFKKARPIIATGDRVVSSLTEPRLAGATSCWQFLYRRAFLDQNGTVFSPRLKQREDRLFLVEAFLKASKIGIMPKAVIHHYWRPGSSFTQIDQSQFEQYLTHVQELNGAIGAARAACRVSEDFETANSSVYFNSLYNYWFRLYLKLSEASVDHPLILKCKAEFKKLASKSASFFDNESINSSDLADERTLEGVIDVLRLAIDHDNDAAIHKILLRQKLSLSELMPLRGDPVADRVICRYISFTRAAKVNYSIPPKLSDPPKRLSEIVTRVILHVGCPKTGTSALQHTLEQNRLRLIEGGIHYPVTGTYREFGIRRERTAGHARLISCLLNSDSTILEELCAEIQSLNRPIHTLILSSENILSPRFWSPDAGLAFILERLGASNVEVVAVMRRQDDWMRSLYIEHTSNPWNSYTSSLTSLIEDYASIGLLDYEAVLKTLALPKQVSAVHVGSFEKIREGSGTISWFKQVTNLPDIELLPITSEQCNSSLSEAQAALIKLAKANPALRRPALAAVFQSVAYGPSSGGASNLLISGAEIEAFRAKYASFISYYCDRFGVLNRFARPSEARQSGEEFLRVSKELFDLLTTVKHVSVKSNRGSVLSSLNMARAVKYVSVKSNSNLNGRAAAIPKFIQLPLHRFREAKDAWLIRKSGLFDAKYYLKANPDVAKSGVHPLMHFVRYGAYEGRRPNPNLDLTFHLGHDPYSENGAEGEGKGVNPLVQHIRSNL